MSVILMSVRPEYADKIFSGIKKFEFRRRLPLKKVEKIIIYSSAPVNKVIGEVNVDGVLFRDPSSLWEITQHYAGISKEKFFKYFNNRSCAYAYILGQFILYENPQGLSAFGLQKPPQSFTYINFLI